ncbi:hypothetical protein EAI_14897, partial [Harpegnathos saltator]
ENHLEQFIDEKDEKVWKNGIMKLPQKMGK